MAGAGLIIVFVAVLAGCTIWSGVYLLFTAHYFLVTLIDTSAGIDEVHYPVEPLFDRWWKPIFCLWLVGFWGIAGGALLAPCLIRHQEAMAICLAALVFLMFPISVLSTLNTRLWIHFVHLPIVWRLLRYYGSLTYVYFVTLLLVSSCVGVLIAVFLHSRLWLLAAALVVPTALLLYARHWGRLVWLTHTKAPKKKQRRRPARGAQERPSEDAVPEIVVEEMAAEEPELAPSQEQEEDEWSRNKKPYDVAQTAEEPAFAVEEKTTADKPISLSGYYDEQHAEEEKRKEKAEPVLQFLPPNTKTPTFKSALVRGVWEFMIYPRTLQVWVNMVLLTLMELVLVVALVRFWPAL